ncbi:hypothetical protein [Hydrogenovibrio kuenenii]|uniref:hypothetical protein n=1 Tax=Hydrogenovibrio kuenenii TaxID=63658 RepID=UPI00046653D0|nr:hypothetical protein [Hydrogenovibrio kuenenii]
MSKVNSESNFEPIDCFKCKHFYITWDDANPKGCRAFGFKTQRLPSVVVFEASGEPCMKFSPKTDEPTTSSRNKKNNDGWIA